MRRKLSEYFRRRPQPWPVSATTPTTFIKADPSLAVVAVAYDMPRQIGNTLITLCPNYQQNIDAATYRAHVVDNGSPRPLDESLWRIWDRISYEYIPPDRVTGNLSVALNRGVAATSSNLIGLVIDGACMLSPGLLRWAVNLTSISSRTLVEVRCWHLGHQLQMQSRNEGYTSDVEQQMLREIGWPKPTYRLFDIATPLLPRGGFFGRSAENTCLFLSRQHYEELGGFDERYKDPGGGLCAADFFYRAATTADQVFIILGEGVFHQIHAGASNSLAADDHRMKFKKWRDEYERLSRPWQGSGPPYQPIHAGHIPRELLRWLPAGGSGR